MSEGLIVRPGDTLFLPLAPPSNFTAQERDWMQNAMQSQMPGVKVVVAEGISGGPFVYRPAPPVLREDGTDG